MDSFLDLARKRFSCRSFLDKDVPKEIIEKIFEAARIAPSAVNGQPWLFVVISDESLKKMIASCYSRTWLESAPAIIVACGDHNRSWRRADGKDHCDIDMAIAIDHLMLAATDNGLATCWVCKFDVMKCSSILELPAHITPIALIPLGYPKDMINPEKHLEKRKLLCDIVFWEKIKF
ncbi:MAG: nitroreductase family protein [Bacteroidales bacterium]|nr:nitroreductase family protein [Bacteroidales bacterium]